MESGTRLLCLILFVCSGLLQRGGRGRGSVCSFSILYRISLFPFLFAVVCVFTIFFFFQKKTVSDLCSVFPLRCVTTYALFFLILFPPSLRLASRFTHCSPQRDPTRSVVPNPHRIVPYRTILQYVFSSSPSNRLTNQTFSNLDDALYVFDRSESGEDGTKSPRSSPMMPMYAPSINIYPWPSFCFKSEACIARVFWNEKYSMYFHYYASRLPIKVI